MMFSELSLTLLKYAYSCSILACEETLSADKMAMYAQELLQLIRDTLDIGRYHFSCLSQRKQGLVEKVLRSP